jgi:hypothetical protein
VIKVTIADNYDSVMSKKISKPKNCTLGASCKGTCIDKSKNCLVTNNPAVAVAATKLGTEQKPWPKGINSVAWGRFQVVHTGHEKLFNSADKVLASKASPAHIKELKKLYPDKKFESVDKGLFNYLSGFKTPAPNVILGEDNKALGDQLLKYKLATKVTYIPRESVGSTASSSRARELFRSGSSPQELVDSGLFESLPKAIYAQKIALDLV